MRRNGTFLELAYDYVKTLIFDGAIEPGERVDVDAIVAHLNFSRQPVRDAINRLAAEGFVRVIPQVGCVIPSVTAEDVRDFVEVFAPFEGRMAAFAATRRSPDDVVTLARLSAEIDALLANDRARSFRLTGATYRALNRRLHGAIHAMAGTPTVQRIGSGFLDRCDFYIASTVSVSHGRFSPLPPRDQHDDVIEAIEARDAPAASRSMERHVRASMDGLFAYLEPERSVEADVVAR